jgi:hypothetical protein
MSPASNSKEKTVLVVHPSWRAYVEFIAGGVLLIPYGIGLILLGWVFYRVRGIQYAVTTRRIVRRSGVFKKTKTAIELRAVKNVEFYQGTIGKFMDTGDVLMFDEPGGKKPIFAIKGVDSPGALAAEINRIVLKAAKP